MFLLLLDQPGRMTEKPERKFKTSNGAPQALYFFHIAPAGFLIPFRVLIDTISYTKLDGNRLINL